MKFRKLYLKIFFSSLIVFIFAHILTFFLFKFFVNKYIQATTLDILESRAKVIIDLIQNKIDKSSMDDKENRLLYELVDDIGRIYGAKVWITLPDKKGVIRTFGGEIPVLSEADLIQYKHFYYKNIFGNEPYKYLHVPLPFLDQKTGSVTLEIYIRE